MNALAVAWPGATGRGRRAESRRRFVVRAIYLVYILALIEGPLRKWFLPGFATPLIFLRDPVVAFIYAYCFANRLIAWNALSGLWLGMAVLTSILGVFQYTFSGVSPLGWPLGIRTYWLYVPLAFVVAGTFRREDVERFLYWNVLLAIPYAVLVAIQYKAGPGAWINLGIAGDEAAVGISDLIVRPFGIFTYTGPNVDFTAAMIAMFIAFYLSRGRRLLGGPILLAGAVAVGMMAVLTGSRGIYFLAAAILGMTILGSTLARPTPRTFARNIVVLAFAVLAAVLLAKLFPDMLGAMDRRFEVAARSEGSIWRRVFEGIFSFVPALSGAPIFGHGIGMGAPGVAGYLGLPDLIYGESDLERNVNELGILFGGAFILLRFATAGWLAWAAIGAARRGVPAALPLAGYAAVAIAVGQITHSPLNAFLPWLLSGLLLALKRDGARG